MTPPEDLLKRALEVHGRFVRGELGRDAHTVLDEHDDLREFLEPMLEEELAPSHPDEVGDFELVRELGRGGMGVVYEAVQKSLGRRVALKLLPPSHTASPRAIARFRREAALAAGLDHPGIAKVHCLEEVDGQFHLAMALIDGVSLDRVLGALGDRDPGSLSVDGFLGALGTAEPPAAPPAWRGRYVSACVDLTRQVAEALAHAHGRGVVHRDVKPGNILLAEDGRAVLTDFGLARGDHGPGVTRSGEFAGTYHYASPEQLTGRAIDARSDVFSLGVTLYELLALRRPFEAESVAELQRRIERDEPQDIRRINRGVDRNLAAVLAKALEKSPDRRYPNASELAADLQRCRDGEPVLARPVPWVVRSGRWMARNPLPSALASVLLVGTIAVTSLALITDDALAKYHDLRVGTELRAVLLREAEAHPPGPATLAELDHLIAVAETELLPSIDRHQATMRGLRRGSLRPAGTPRHPDRGAHPDARRATELEGSVIKLTGENRSSQIPDAIREATAAEIADLADEAARLREEIAESDRVWIDDPRTRHLYDELERQHSALRRFAVDVYPDLLFRRDAAATAAARAASRTAAWQEVGQRLARDPRFASWVVEPELDLAPLGPDPRSGLEEFAHLPTGDAPTRQPDGSLSIDTESALVLVLVPGGTHTFDGAANAVDLDPFYLGKHEMNRAQWRRLARSRPGLRLRDGGIFDVRNSAQPEKPANGMTWDMADATLKRGGLRLPTEAQWTHALARDGVPGSREDWSQRVNLRDQSYASARGRDDGLPYRDGFVGFAPVQAMAPGALGLHHLLGNAREWCRDPFHPRPPLRDGDGAAEAESWPSAMRVRRGGSFLEGDREFVTEGRDRAAPGTASRDTGVRPLRTARARS